ncbi:MAG TPA: UDP-N-acetylmuramate--L-alanine ligase [Kiritimatiellia bacterium]|nr:UDP-N-acetylmuramate--L-alanine ligase [Kiritimatiellia bacterium]
MQGADATRIVPDIADIWKKRQGVIHMLGIGGVGMAGLAILLKRSGWTVHGCDSTEGSLTSWLRSEGVGVLIGHDSVHLNDRPDFIIRSPAVRNGEPELERAKKLGIPVVDRGQILPLLLNNRVSIAVAGTHGKTTTTSMIAWMLDQAGYPVSFCIGGICPGLNVVAREDSESCIVVEADESDGTLRHYHPTIAVITSMDLDHVDFFADNSQVHQTYRAFVENAENVVFSADDPMATSVAVDHAQSVGYGLQYGDARITGIQLGASESSFIYQLSDREPLVVNLALSGKHNVINAAGAITAVSRLGVDIRVAVAALSQFQLPKRRFEIVADGKGITVISDYAHHPVEIESLLQQASLRQSRRIIGVFQPHRYSRTRAFREAFAEVLIKLDVLVLVPVYSASEPYLEGGTSEDLFLTLRERGQNPMHLAESVEDGWQKLKKIWQSGDLVLIIGAGDIDLIGKWSSRELG